MEVSMETIRHILQLKGGDVWTTTPETSVYDALLIMADKDIGALLVMENDKMVGIISERDYARKVILQGKASKSTKVSEIMTRDVLTIHPDQTVEEAMEIMGRKHIRHLPVVEEKRVIGVISIMDTNRNIIYRQRQTIREMEDKILSNPK
jgi:CBS domain-containing protein